MLYLMKFFRWLIPLLVFLMIAFFLWQGLKQPNPNQIPSPLINKPLPVIDATDLVADPPVKVKNQDFLGHITLLNVWASWCISCKAEHSVMMDIARSGKVLVYGLNYKDHRDDAIRWLKKAGNPYMVDIYDPKGEIALNLGVYGTPETFLIDQNGIIRYKYVGPVSPEVWQEELLPRIQQLTTE